MKINLKNIFNILKKNFGPQFWWPIDKKYHKKNNSDPRFEIIIGAILTQNTAWSNVEKALENLKSKNMIDAKKISQIDIKILREKIKSSGFFNQKASRLKNFSKHLLKNYEGNLNNFFNRDSNEIRKELLSLNGIGPETADSILLYAGSFPVFVVDAYTKRLCERLNLPVNLSYEDIQEYFENNLYKIYSKKELVKVFNEFHALIVVFAKNYCKKKPLCEKCPLKKYCSYFNNS